ncbi:MAG: hypothetical protein COA57_01275 [Flavobacteriales bacterium]|nr:MAG: hypothetical protein COA57_01275 [Flavobacteriales bacterium]
MNYRVTIFLTENTLGTLKKQLADVFSWKGLNLRIFQNEDAILAAKNQHPQAIILSENVSDEKLKLIKISFSKSEVILLTQNKAQQHKMLEIEKGIYEYMNEENLLSELNVRKAEFFHGEMVF